MLAPVTAVGAIAGQERKSVRESSHLEAPAEEARARRGLKIRQLVWEPGPARLPPIAICSGACAMWGGPGVRRHHPGDGRSCTLVGLFPWASSCVCSPQIAPAAGQLSGLLVLLVLAVTVLIASALPPPSFVGVSLILSRCTGSGGALLLEMGRGRSRHGRHKSAMLYSAVRTAALDLSLKPASSWLPFGHRSEGKPREIPGQGGLGWRPEPTCLGLAGNLPAVALIQLCVSWLPVSLMVAVQPRPYTRMLALCCWFQYVPSRRRFREAGALDLERLCLANWMLWFG